VVSKKQLIEVTESAIDNLAKTFKKSPYFFYTESDLHCYLYNEIFNELPLEDWQCKTKNGKSSILLHKEYPTKERYSAKDLQENVSGGARGHFDVCIWNPERTGERLFRARSTNFEEEQHTFIAVEFDLIEGSESLEQAVHHFRWDLLKLKGQKNEVEFGYSLVFVRDWIYGKQFLKKIKKEVTEENIAVLYAEKSGGSKIIGTLSKKPFHNYKRLFK
jgi:hypothetical protein